MKRRDFLNWVGVGWLASSLPVAIAACSPTSTQSPTSISQEPRTDGFKVVGTVKTLDKKESIEAQVDGSPTVIIRDPANKDTVLALDAVCGHNGCVVKWNDNRKEFVCPCHGSAYAPDGRVLKGPSEVPLASYKAKLEGDAVLVKIS